MDKFHSTNHNWKSIEFITLLYGTARYVIWLATHHIVVFSPVDCYRVTWAKIQNLCNDGWHFRILLHSLSMVMNILVQKFCRHSFIAINNVITMRQIKKGNVQWLHCFLPSVAISRWSLVKSTGACNSPTIWWFIKFHLMRLMLSSIPSPIAIFHINVKWTCNKLK